MERDREPEVETSRDREHSEIKEYRKYCICDSTRIFLHELEAKVLAQVLDDYCTQGCNTELNLKMGWDGEVIPPAEVEKERPWMNYKYMVWAEAQFIDKPEIP